jgi:hypothetical protein
MGQKTIEERINEEHDRYCNIVRDHFGHGVTNYPYHIYHGAEHIIHGEIDFYTIQDRSLIICEVKLTDKYNHRVKARKQLDKNERFLLNYMYPNTGIAIDEVQKYYVYPTGKDEVRMVKYQ